jgi:hypothetical protein
MAVSENTQVLAAARRLSRRSLFASATAAAAAPAVAAAEHPDAATAAGLAAPAAVIATDTSPDAELIRLCGEFDALEHQANPSYSRHGRDSLAGVA